MKRTAPLFVFIATLVASGCASRDTTGSREPIPFAVTAAVTGGAVIGAIVAPGALPAAAIVSEHRKNEAAAFRELLDPIYEKRTTEIRGRNAAADVTRIIESVGILFIPAFPGTGYYAGFVRGAPDLPSPDMNAGAIRSSPVAQKLIALTSDDDRHPKGKMSILYFSPAYVAFRRAAWDYKTSFNQAMLQRLRSKTSNKAPEPTLGIARFPQGSEVSNAIAGVAHL